MSWNIEDPLLRVPRQAPQVMQPRQGPVWGHTRHIKPQAHVMTEANFEDGTCSIYCIVSLSLSLQKP